jgi:hypothetical protein
MRIDTAKSMETFVYAHLTLSILLALLGIGFVANLADCGKELVASCADIVMEYRLGSLFPFADRLYVSAGVVGLASPFLFQSSWVTSTSVVRIPVNEGSGGALLEVSVPLTLPPMARSSERFWKISMPTRTYIMMAAKIQTHMGA